MTLDDLYDIAEKVKENLQGFTNGLIIEYSLYPKNLENIDRQLYDITNNDKPFKHTNVVNATINGITFRLKENTITK